jgi:hypothetical protein
VASAQENVHRLRNPYQGLMTMNCEQYGCPFYLVCLVPVKDLYTFRCQHCNRVHITKTVRTQAPDCETTTDYNLPAHILLGCSLAVHVRLDMRRLCSGCVNQWRPHNSGRHG